MSEIEAFPRAVLSHHYPEVPLHGDFTTIQAGQYAAIDVLCGGTPCQSFSVAGLRGGLADERGNLALEFLRLAERLRPRWVVWENVPGVLSSSGGRDFGAFLGGLAECGYGWAYRVLDAQYFGLAQRRQRVFVVGYLGDWRPPAAVLFEPASLRGHPAPRREAGKRVAPTVARGSPGGRTYGLDADTADSLVAATSSGYGWWDKADVGATLRAQDSITKADTLVAHVPTVSPALKARDFKGPSSDGDGDGAPLIAHTLRAEGHDASEDGTGRGVPLVAATLTSGRGGSGRPAGRRQEDDSNLIAFGWQNSASQGDSLSAHHAPTLDKSKTPAVAFAIQERAVSENPNAGPQGRGFQAGLAYTLEARHHAQSVAFDLAQITSAANRTRAEPGLPASTLLKNSAMHMALPMAVRRLTPLECERLQGFPNDYTLIPYRNGMAVDGPRYRALGNSMAVPVVRWIGRRIAKVDAQ